jgi:hypothetical protein
MQHWLAKCSRPWMAADAGRVSELTERAVTAARAAGEPSTEALAIVEAGRAAWSSHGLTQEAARAIAGGYTWEAASLGSSAP